MNAEQLILDLEKFLDWHYELETRHMELSKKKLGTEQGNQSFIIASTTKVMTSELRDIIKKHKSQ
jgi:hypothetical protein